MKVLFIGGTGVISSACVQSARERGLNVTVLNRGQTQRQLPPGVRRLHANVRDPQSMQQALADESFDVIINFIAFEPAHVEPDIQLFRDRCRQYIFISSASCYQTPPPRLPITEDMVLANPVWEYSRKKIACEQVLMDVYEKFDFPATIVRPSHTYDRTKLPNRGGWTAIDRLRRGKPIFIHGDGTSLWTLTHHADFAAGFTALLGHPEAIGEAFHITSDEWLTWDQIHESIAAAAGVELRAVHLPSEFTAAYDAEMGKGLLGDKMHSMIFDNSKLKKLAPNFSATRPFADGAKEIIRWYEEDKQRRNIDADFNALTEEMISAYRRSFPSARLNTQT